MFLKPYNSISLILALLITVLLAAGEASADKLKLKISGKLISLEGEILIEAQDNGLFFQQNNGKIWFVEPEQIQEKVVEDKIVEPISKKELGEQLLKELPGGFRIYETKHYVIAYQTELAYARWVGGLYESRLYHSFEKYWEKRKKFKLTEPKFPLPVIVFSTQAQFQQQVDREFGPGQKMLAYYGIQSNRVTLYDLTAGQKSPNQPLDNDRRIDEVLSSPAAKPMVATMIHEATHQLIFNRGMQTRYAESPLWLNEGLANFFEAPSRKGRGRGWVGPGEIFEQRLFRYRKLLQTNQTPTIESLVLDNKRFNTPETFLDAYAEAWALNHYLLNKKPKEFVAYLNHMAKKKALDEDPPAKRLIEFKQFFGDIGELEADLYKYVVRLK